MKPLACPVFTKSLKRGSTGAEVRKAQELLRSTGLLPKQVAMGAFVPMTEAAVKAFHLRYRDEILLPASGTPTGLWHQKGFRKTGALSGCAS